MNVIKLSPRLFCLDFETQKELSLSLCRFSEFAEGGDILRSKKFNMDEFLDSYMDDDGEIDFFSYFDGFNIPMRSITKFVCTFKHDLSKRELAVLDSLKGIEESGYVIGVVKHDQHTLAHEVVHFVYDEVPVYRRQAIMIINSIPNKMFTKMRKGLMDSYYAEDVIYDEINAYLVAYSKSDAKDLFPGVRRWRLKKYVKELQALFAEYNTIRL
jgi:hypothetical protein